MPKNVSKNLWIAKHKPLSYILLTIFAVLLFIPVVLLELNDIVFLRYVYIALIVSSYTFITLSAQTTMNKAIVYLNVNCDPFPLLEVTTQLLPLKHNKTETFLIEHNYCVSLYETGRYQQAYDRLSAMDSKRVEKMPPLHKAVYYYNLFVFCYALKNYSLATEWYDKLISFDKGIKNKVYKKSVANFMLNAGAIYADIQGDYEQAAKLLDGIITNPNSTKSVIVYAHYIYADICIKAGKLQHAEKCLNYVINNGNKLFCVPESKFKLDNLYK